MVKELLVQLDSKEIQFKDVLGYIAERYDYTSSAFQNGSLHNEAHENQGSARVLSFAKIHNLSQEDTLKIFAEHYAAVLSVPEGADHQNIRQFMQNGWEGVKFEREVLREK